MRVWICAVAKMEERYIREWIEWHKKIGVDHIIIGDNNDEDYKPSISSAIAEYVSNGYVEVVDKKGILNVQQPFYKDIYANRKDEFDWIGFIDIDEFIHLPAFDNNIHRFLGDERLNGYSAVILSWMNIGDCNNVYYENKPVQERFKDREDARTSNIGIKYFIRPLENVRICSIHNPFYLKNNECVTACDSCFNKVENKSRGLTKLPVKEEYYSSCYIRHYITKSTEEYILNKMLRGRCDRMVGHHDLRYTKKFYFVRNKWTAEKEALFNQYDSSINKAQSEEIKKYKKRDE